MDFCSYPPAQMSAPKARVSCIVKCETYLALRIAFSGQNRDGGQTTEDRRRTKNSKSESFDRAQDRYRDPTPRCLGRCLEPDVVSETNLNDQNRTLQRRLDLSGIDNQT